MTSSAKQSQFSATDYSIDAELAADAEFTARERLAYLDQVVESWRTRANTEQKAPPEEGAPGPASKSRRSESNRDQQKPAASKPTPEQEWPRTVVAVKSFLALAVAVVLGWVPIQRLLATTSAEATVNARLVVLRAPIEGDVSLATADSDIGTEFRAGQDVLTISNPRADAQHLGDLRRDRDRTLTAIGALEGKMQVLLANLEELSNQQDRFRVGRILQLEQRVKETDTAIAAAKAQVSVASDALKRAQSLRETDAVSQAFLDKAVGEDAVARETLSGVTERRKGMLVELSSAKTGTFIGDSYNDTPQSAQRKMEVELDLADVRARLKGSNSELASIESDIADEKARQQQLSRVTVRSTVNGRVWELLTAPGEHVNAGQDLLKVLDCGSAIVTASVSETAFQRLSVGQTATFRRREDGVQIRGWIVGLNGLAAVASNSAIQQGALTREPYHVTLKFPDLAKSADCQIGRSGLVTFDTGSNAFASFIP